MNSLFISIRSILSVAVGHSVAGSGSLFWTVQTLFEEADIDFYKVMPSKLPGHPVCYSSDLPIFNFSLAESCKAVTHDYEFRAKFMDVG